MMLMVVALVIFYVFIVVIAITLFNMAIVLIFLMLFWKYVQWACKEIIKLRKTINLHQIKLFL